ncbi:4-(cytidine 5'-diphospho)-2-C-methyl-D-erythritol kinase [Leptospira levettii]|uniref:4-diphosphocytidyl-2-C-methyl-D-erythritol kinase n=1 Tax=Leptospira levettii TaxID=2023178 RepID=A0AAW5V6D4_9LEPT|nr:4-(cytidine 5'-diphospho)-2-C-methyl-D-erythritol kinase [Leptospira levettii]PKA24560.1 4-(cytidine 5'-diphospho)-2-C-methyl-D-erythritol kinase [Leptospira sp. mixed culture ATI2-C-A1]MCW7465225.1 4-(cytidine 5'-diphospho)-2-C-methyl-D-erythritol kinase [Leptospira levettii]MCW7509965.1 4-(cytidine 5'-diphospho)-2-C-methyl-D-erythritol kinase [Leptospira levettii]MCW7513715.1 4-(cytidine 5'-diphospho)-2-C-methyl-D-erythritol kinase [Leptospira levettii]TGM84258.1 4-(cytidine 5'-diphospho)
MLTTTHAKINIGLVIPYKREDGLHEIRSVFVPIDLCDPMDIQIQSLPGGNESTFEFHSMNHLQGYRHVLFEAVSERGDLSRNILTKSFVKLKPHFKTPVKITIHLEKFLPPEGGIGGGSSNAGVFLRELFPFTNLNPEEQIGFAKSIGADVPFFLQSSPCFVSGIGEVLEPISVAKGYGILAIPPFGLSTGSMYAGLQKSLQKPYGSEVWKSLAEDLIRSLHVGDWAYLQNRLENEFEKIAFQTQPLLKELKLGFFESGADFASLSGSGSCLYGIYKAEEKRNEALPNVSHRFPEMEFRTFSF